MKISCSFQKSSDLQFGADVSGSAGGISDCVSREDELEFKVETEES